ncbi:MAG: phosphoribosylaminoimidazolesuccinocarboxamide synthase [Rhodospirillaceae bacterium]|nr:MAG: phosphoribosylaminoimidazolesuccinocarboxamide synthase [Rhodospirillaceae bacterium]
MSIKLPHVFAGKTRDIYDAGDDRLLIVASDRLSLFDSVIAEPIRGKGRALTAINAFWFEYSANICAHHMISVAIDDFPQQARIPELEGRAMLVRRADILPFDCVVRSHLSGLAWLEYRKLGTVHGEQVPPGLCHGDPLPELTIAMSRRAVGGQDQAPDGYSPTTSHHDKGVYLMDSDGPARVEVNMTFDDAADLVGRPLAERAREVALEVYRRCAKRLNERGVVVADTLFKLGLIDGELALCDEVLSPDSSRLTLADQWEPGTVMPSITKEPLLTYYNTIGWDKRPPPPPVPEALVSTIAARHADLCERITRA